MERLGPFMTKDEIIEKQSKLILELVKIGQEKYQEIFNLFCAIEKTPKDKIEKEVVELPKDVIGINTKQKRICPCCKTRDRAVSNASGKMYAYCRECLSEKNKSRTIKKSNGLSDRDNLALKALGGEI